MLLQSFIRDTGPYQKPIDKLMLAGSGTGPGATQADTGAIGAKTIGRRHGIAWNRAEAGDMLAAGLPSNATGLPETDLQLLI